MAWSRLEDGLDENAKILSFSDRAFRLWLCSITFCNRNVTGGFLSREQARIVAAGQRLPASKTIAELVEKRGWDEVPGGGYYIHDYTDFNLSREEALERKKAISSARSAAGRAGARSRWQDGKRYSKGDGNPHGKLPSSAAEKAAENQDGSPESSSKTGKIESKLSSRRSRESRGSSSAPASLQVEKTDKSHVLNKPAWQTDGPVPDPVPNTPSPSPSPSPGEPGERGPSDTGPEDPRTREALVQLNLGRGADNGEPTTVKTAGLLKPMRGRKLSSAELEHRRQELLDQAKETT